MSLPALCCLLFSYFSPCVLFRSLVCNLQGHLRKERKRKDWIKGRVTNPHGKWSALMPGRSTVDHRCEDLAGRADAVWSYLPELKPWKGCSRVDTWPTYVHTAKTHVNWLLRNVVLHRSQDVTSWKLLTLLEPPGKFFLWDKLKQEKSYMGDFQEFCCVLKSLWQKVTKVKS